LKRLLCLFLALWPLVARLPAQDRLHEADALVAYAESLGNKGTAVLINKDGLTIDGHTLTSGKIVRPAVALSRAAELYAELSNQTRSITQLKKAVEIWESLDDIQTPIPYMRLFSRSDKKENDPFLIFCHVILAETYLKQGDQASAEKVLIPYVEETSSSMMVGLARATYASMRLAEGDFESAEKIAEEVATTVPRDDFFRDKRNGYQIALAVLSQIPGRLKEGLSITSDEATLLHTAKGNPSRYFQLANAMYKAGDKRKAISYWDEYRKHFASDPRAREAALKAADTYEELKEMDAAIEAFRATSIQYSNQREGAKAAVKAAQLMDGKGETSKALEFLEESARRISTAYGQAMLLSIQGELLIKSGKIDDAVDRYMLVIVKYGDQDPAKEAISELRRQAPKINNWRRFTQAVQMWLTGRYGDPGKVGNAALNVSEASQIRRLALGFYAEDENVASGISWLKTLGMKSTEQDRNWFIRDEAWFNAQVVHVMARNPNRLQRHNLTSALKLGIRAWEIAPGTEEGLDGIRAAFELIMKSDADKTMMRQLSRELERLAVGDFRSKVTDMLIPLYKRMGDDKALNELEKSLGNQ